MSDTIRPFVLALLLENGPLPTSVSVDEYRYLDIGHVDSIGFLRFMLRIEEEFDIRFSQSDIISEEIRSVGGLIRIIASKYKSPTI